MKTIPLTNSDDVAIVDDEDYEFLRKITWSKHTGGYIQGYYNGKTVYMHRLINNTSKGKHTDHINHNRLDNRKGNLRECTALQNQQYAIKLNGSIPYRGVTYDKRKKSKPYQARIKIDKYHKHIGMFATPEEAAMEYNVYAYIYHGEFALLNNIHYGKGKEDAAILHQGTE